MAARAHMQRAWRGQRGFTFVELLVTVVIVAILASVTMPMTELVVQRNKEHELRRALLEIRTALDAYKQADADGHIARGPGASGYPRRLEVLVDGVPDAKSATGAKLYFLRRIPRDPFFADPAAPPANTWGKRSYASSADEPREGDDVYDVYSLAPGNALDASAYREW